MISAATEQLLQKLFRLQNSYKPAPAISAELSTKTLVMVIGATCVGKNTVMHELATIDPDFGVSGTFTSRPPREDDDASLYTYYEHSDEGLAPLLERIATKQVAQYAINPHSLLMYGTEAQDYPFRYNLKDIFSNAIAGFLQLGFKRTIAITIVTQPDLWLHRFESRFPPGHPQRAARCDEAIDSFTWSLEQTGEDRYWVENADGHSDEAARTIQAIALGTSQGQPEARRLAEACLKAARAITV